MAPWARAHPLSWWCGALFWLLLLGLTACGEGRSQGTLRLAQANALYSLDPVAAADAESRAILANLYEGLVAFDRDMHIVPALAVGWNAPDDHTWVFELRPRVRFHDGGILTAADVKFSLERVGNAREPDPVAGIAAVEIVDDYHVRLRTVRADPLLLNRLAQLLIVPAGDVDPDLRPVGTGPFRLVRRGPPLELEAFPGHWHGRPAVERVSFSAVPGDRLDETLTRREVDVYRLPPGTPPRLLAARPHYRTAERPGLAVNYLWFNCSASFEGRKNPFADARVRRALSLSLDRAEIVRRLGGHDQPAEQLLPNGVFGFMPGWTIAFDTGKARALLKEGGYGDGFETTLAHGPGDPQRTLAAAVRELLAPIGIRVTPEELPRLQLLEARRDQRLAFFALPWTFDDGDAWTFLMASLHSRRGPGDLRSTNPGYANPVLDRLIEDSQGASSAEELSLRYARVFRLALAELPIVPVYSSHDLYALSERAVFEPRVDGKLIAAEMRLLR